MLPVMLLAVLAANVLVFTPGLGGPLVFDDLGAITANETLRDLRDLRSVLWPPKDTSVSGRPIPNLTLAINYQFHKLNPWGYRATNLAIHCLNALLLLGLVLKLARSPRSPNHVQQLAVPLAVIVGAIWSLHPLQSESVLYATQRTELSVGFMMLFMVFSLVSARLAQHPFSRRFWLLMTGLACLLGMFCKEVMFAAPLLALLVDRAWFGQSYPQVLREHRRFYLWLAACWIPMAMILASQPRALSVGFNHGISAWENLNTQAVVILIYVRQVFLPYDLAIVNNIFIIDDRWRTIPSGLFILLWVAGTFWGIYRGSWLGVLGAWFFLILAPSSSIVPIATEVMAERRMYLPLASIVIALSVLGLQAFHDLSAWKVALRPALQAGYVAVGLLVAAVAGFSTHQRSFTWLSAEAIYLEALIYYPNSEIAINNLAAVYVQQSRHADALPYLHRMLPYKTHSASMFSLLGLIAEGRGQSELARRLHIHALCLSPRHHAARARLAAVEHRMGNSQEALRQAEIAREIAPESLEVLSLHARLQLETGDLANALATVQRIQQLSRDSIDALSIWAEAELALGNHAKARELAERALRINPAFRAAGLALARAGEKILPPDQAREGYEQMLQRQPGYAPLHEAFGQFLLQCKQPDAARIQFQAALRLAPRSLPANLGLARALTALGRDAQARSQWERLAQLQPDHPELPSTLQPPPATRPSSSHP